MRVMFRRLPWLFCLFAFPSCLSRTNGVSVDGGGADFASPHVDSATHVDSALPGDAATGDSATNNPNSPARRARPVHPPTAPRRNVNAPTSSTWTFTGGSIQPAVVEVRGTFNNWAPGATPMTLAGGTWTATVNLAWGSTVEYKFWAQWSDNPGSPLWTTDPLNPNTDPATGNSEIENISCTAWTCPSGPYLVLVAAPTVDTSSYSFQVMYVPGSAELDTSKTVVTLNGTTVDTTAAPYDAGSHLFTVAVSSGVQAPSKISYLFKVQDTQGNPSSLFIPFWIEASPFEWKDSFMYEVMIDRFLHGDTSLAGPVGSPTDPAGDWKGGDFGGVTGKIIEGYFDNMGVNTLWISSPVLSTKLCEMGTGANTGHCLSGYHSYFPLASGWVDGSETDPLFTSNGVTGPIDPHFGTADDLKILVETAHAHGIRVLTDLVVNHVFADASPPSGQTAQLAPLWTAHQSGTQWFNTPYGLTTNNCGYNNLWDTPTTQTWNRTNCWFDSYLPDLNTTTPVVNDTIANHAVWLMEEFNLDGFRVDATKQVMNNICVDLRSKLQAAIGTDLAFYMVGEALGSNLDNVMDCVGSDRLNGSTDDPLHYSIVSTFLTGSENFTSFDSDLASDESTWTGRYSDALMGHFFGSHDVARAISEAANDVGDAWTSPPPASETSASSFQRLSLAQAFLLTYDSVPILWMGDEFGMPGSYDPDNRRMMRFGANLSASESSTLTNLQKLGKLRAAHSALRRGNRTQLWVEANFYAYGRVDGQDIVVAAFNRDPTNSATHSISVGGIGLTGTVTDGLSGTTATVSGGSLTITLAPLTAAVYTP